MSVRGTTHAIHTKKIINHDRGGTYVMCAWLDCDRDGCTLHQVRVNTAADHAEPRFVWYTFCTERHRQYWIEATLRPGSGNNLPSGFRNSIL